MSAESAATGPSAGSWQPGIEARGREIFARMQGATPGLFNPHRLAGRLMAWAMGNEALKVRLFRFVDALPSLGSSRAIARHAEEYLGDASSGLPSWAKWGVRLSPHFPWVTAFIARRCVAEMAATFILARDASEAIPALVRMRRQPLAFTLDILGETAVSEPEAERYAARYLTLIETLAREATLWPAVDQIDRDDRGDLPRVNISLKISALHPAILPTDPEGAIRHLAARIRPLLIAARDRGVFINFDMESTALKDLTMELFKRLLDEPDFRGYPHAGLALQAYLVDSARDLDGLLDWAASRNRRITIRLIKGAYWDYEVALARQRGWPIPVFLHKSETDANYERLARRMLASPQFIDCAFGTHSVRSIAACSVMADALGRKPRSFEFQMLHGMAGPIKLALVTMGYRVRDYCPIGEVLPGMSYLVRRLLENTSNEGFLRATFVAHAKPDQLLRDPANVPRTRTPPPAIAQKGNMDPLPFENQPPTDFTIADNRRRMQAALEQVRAGLGRDYPLVIGGAEKWTEHRIISTNPARPAEVIGRVARASRAEADLAVAAAQAAFRDWSRRTVEERSRIVARAGELLREERFELAALEVFETGKTWIEADADVGEAIDFCNYYALEMRRIASTTHAIPGETSTCQYIPRGLALVIAPWNFPLAILCGMTTAALVAGDCVIFKPSEQSTVIAARFMDILRRAGVPAGAANYLPGPGGEVGAYLVAHPQIDVIAFTGSREVGLKIYEAAGHTQPGQRQLKKVVCEMGGKNAAIIDDDADLDDAIPAALHSAFGYQGQKCSALSRLILLPQNHDRALERLIEAARSLTVGLPEDPGTVLGPVIDQAAFDRIRQYIELGKREARLVFEGSVPASLSGGWFIPPVIFSDVPPQARIAQEEIFGPVLCVLKAADLDQALAWANATPYALTGGFFSRSPANIQRATAEMEVGNLYINRPITGALVARHPFGGYKMSGGGTKAGGPDYLQNFLLPRVVTENTVRRGFAPEMEGG
jgi:RHH-type proline utilization regulon transcriptional repressor/proline dehydrogenase/delta 1-pyrroline-5-carboxylate dehydrogenase